WKSAPGLGICATFIGAVASFVAGIIPPKNSVASLYPANSKMTSSSTAAPSGGLATPYTKRQGLLALPTTSCSSADAASGLPVHLSCEPRRCTKPCLFGSSQLLSYD